MLRKFLIDGPKLFGAVNHERLAWLIETMFDHEIDFPESVFAHQKGESIDNRLESIRMMGSAAGVDQGKFAFWMDLVTLYATSCAIHAGAVDETFNHGELVASLSVRAKLYTEFTDILTVDQAAQATQWL